MVIRVKIHEKSSPTSGRKQPSSSFSKKKKLSGRTPHNLERSHRDDYHGPSTMKDSSHPRSNCDKVSYDTMVVDSQAPRASRTRKDSRSDAREDNDQSRRGRSKSVDRRENSRNSGRRKQSRSPPYRQYNHRSKSPNRKLPAPRQPPQKKTEYVPLNLQLLEVASCSSKSTSGESKVSHVSRSEPPSPSEEEIATRTRNDNHDYGSNAGVASNNSEDDALASQSSSPGRDDAPSKGVTFINVTTTGQAGAKTSTRCPSMYDGHASRPASPSLSKYASYSEQKGKNNKKNRSKTPSSSHRYQFQRNSSVKPTRSGGRSLSPGTRNSRRRHHADDDYYRAPSEPSGSKSERATRTLGLASSSYIEEEHDKEGQQKAKNERVPRKVVPSWGISTWRSKFTGRNTKIRSTEEGYVNHVKFESREFRDGESDADGDNSHEEYFDDDFESAGKQIQFLSSVVNKFGSYDSEDRDDEVGEHHKLCEIIRTTERLERKLEDVGDPTKPSMTPDEVGELVSALSEMHAQAAKLKRISPAEPCLAEELLVVEEPTEIHDDCSDWFDNLSKTMLGHCQWK